MKSALRTATFLVGLASICTGCVLVHPALGFIAGGVVLVVVAIQEDRAAAKRTDRDAA